MIRVAPRPGSVVTVYHISPAPKDEVISRGLLPEKARGKLKAVWVVDRDMITWAIAHTALHHNVTIGALSCYECHINEALLRRTRWPGVYYVQIPVPVKWLCTAREIVDEVEAEIRR